MAIKVNRAEVGLKIDLIEMGVIMGVQDLDGNQKYLGGDLNKPIQVRVRSIRSQAMKDHQLKIQQLAAKMKRGRREEVVMPDEEFIARQASVAALELINFDADAVIQTATPAELQQLFREPEMQDLANQIWLHCQQDGNYGGDANVGNAGAEAAATPASPTSESSSTAS